MAAIEAHGLTKRYGSLVAVDGVALSIPAGAVYAFLGPNGAGKTTTIRMLTALTPPSSGTASVDGASITDHSQITERIGLLPAEPPVYPELTGREHLHYVARLHELPHDSVGCEIDDWLARFDLEAAADQRIGEYSTGMKKKLGLIAANLHEPSVLFLDEPTSGLDPRAARTVVELIADIAEQNRTIFLSTHILPIAEELADVIGVIHDGVLVAEGNPTELKSMLDSKQDSTLESVFLELTREREAPEPSPPCE